MITTQISIFIENRSGRVSEVVNAIASENINIKALSIADTTNFGILRIIVDNPETVIVKLKDMNLAASLTRVLSVKLKNKPGAVADVLNVLASAGLSIEYMYSSMAYAEDMGDLIICVDKEGEGEEALLKAGYKNGCCCGDK